MKLLDLYIKYGRLNWIPFEMVQRSLDEKQNSSEDIEVVVELCLIDGEKNVLKEVLLKTGYKFDLKDFQLLCKAGKAGLFDLFVENQFNLNQVVKNKRGEIETSPLFEACKYSESAQIIDLMLEHNCWIDLKDKAGRMAYQYALSNQYINTHDVMLKLIPKYLILRKFSEDRVF